ncbi:hypothetical protein PRZ48_005824 [Zasmidium cellare]|uniref:Uncharacterized protein n=1 Tax=Zasmidium cellare TaxID=395010 RepID=A0ABR0ELD4_ZASCE|nr:hypothetical protein PRZ48_005824 [Zasmidium cellare]
MSSRLRRMMGKRSLKNTPTDPADMESSSEELMMAPAKKREPIAKDDLRDVPPPSPAKIKAVEQSARKVSPSKTLLDRYKSRSATSSLTASPPAIKIPAAAPREEDTGSPSPKGTSFKPDFNHQPDPLANAASSANGGRKLKRKGKVAGDAEPPTPLDQHKRLHEGLEMDQIRKEENISPATVEEPESKSRRSTRSTARRQERADSKQESNVGNKGCSSPSLSPVEVPPGLTIRKTAPSRSPSPCSPKSKPADLKQEPVSPKPDLGDLTLPVRPKTPQPPESPVRPSTPPSSSTAPEIPPKSPKRNTPPKFQKAAEDTEGNKSLNSIVDAKDFKDVKETKDTKASKDTKENKASKAAKDTNPHTSTLSTPSPPIVAPLSPTTPKDSPVAVRPPLYDATKTPGKQWESEYGSNSRPTSPWMHSKRWTCCVCQGQTIVEQVVCSRLSCVHDRCPMKCRVESVDRVKGPFQR